MLTQGGGQLRVKRVAGRIYLLPQREKPILNKNLWEAKHPFLKGLLPHSVSTCVCVYCFKKSNFVA